MSSCGIADLPMLGTRRRWRTIPKRCSWSLTTPTPYTTAGTFLFFDALRCSFLRMLLFFSRSQCPTRVLVAFTMPPPRMMTVGVRCVQIGAREDGAERGGAKGFLRCDPVRLNTHTPEEDLCAFFVCSFTLRVLVVVVNASSSSSSSSSLASHEHRTSTPLEPQNASSHNSRGLVHDKLGARAPHPAHACVVVTDCGCAGWLRR
eukprot:3584789-Rhodomonas_salina.1